MPQNRETRRLTQNKQNTVEFKTGRPLDSQGNNGDITIRQLDDGVFLFFKALGKWYKTLNTASQAIPDPSTPRSFSLGAPDKPIERMVISENSLHIGNTKSKMAKISLSSDKTELVFKNSAGAERVVVGKKTGTDAGSAITGTISLGADNETNKEGVLHLGSGTSNNGGIITSTTDYAASAMGLRVLQPATSGSTMQPILTAKSTNAVAVANRGVILSNYDISSGAISLFHATTSSTEASGLADMGTIWVSDDDKPYYRFGTGAAYEMLTTAGSSSIAGNLVPATTETHNLGSATHKWHSLYLHRDSLFLGGIKLQENDGKLALADSDGNEIDDFTSSVYNVEYISTQTNRDFSSGIGNWDAFEDETGNDGLTAFEVSSAQLRMVRDGASSVASRVFLPITAFSGIENGKTYRLSYYVDFSTVIGGTWKVALTNDAYTIANNPNKGAPSSKSHAVGGDTDGRYHIEFVADDSGTDKVDRIAIMTEANVVGTALFDNFSIKEVISVTSATNLAKAALPKSGGTMTGAITMTDTTAPGTPSSGTGVFYVNSDKPYFKNDSGTAFDLSATGSGGGGSGISDADYGDITVSSSGSVFTIDAGVVAYSKIQDVSAQNRILGRESSGAGDVEEITPANLKAMLGLQNVSNIAQLPLNGTDSMSGRLRVDMADANRETNTLGSIIQVDAVTLNDNFTSASSTSSRDFYGHKFLTPTLTATNANVTTTNATTFYIQGAPTASTHQTLTNSYALWIDSGASRFDGAATFSGATSFTTHMNLVADGRFSFGDAAEYITGDGTDLHLVSSNDIHLTGTDLDCNNIRILDANRITFNAGGTIQNCLDEDGMDSDSDTAVPTQQSVKAYADTKQSALTFGKSSGNALKSEEALTTNDILLMGSSHVKGRTYAELKADLSLEIGTDVLAQQTIGIANDNLVEIDGSDIASGEYARFTSNGLESRTIAEIKSDLSLAKADVGLGNADNTSDADKPVSTATQNALNAKQDTLTFGKSNGNALKSEEALATGEVLLMGTNHVQGQSLVDFRTALLVLPLNGGTLTGQLKINISDGNSAPSTDGHILNTDNTTFNDNTTSGGASFAQFYTHKLSKATLTATNSGSGGVTTTDAATLYLEGATVASTNQTITNNYALQLGGGNIKLPDDSKIIFGDAGENISGDGTDLTIASSGDITLDADGGDVVIQDSGSSTPRLKLHNTSDTYGTPPVITFETRPSNDVGADGDDIGRIDFNSDDDGGNVTTYSQILGEISDASGGTEDGKLSFKVALNNTLTTALEIKNSSSANTSEITLGNDSSSNTVVNGTLSAQNITSSGAVTIDSATGNFSTKKDGTEFSVANSSYAGMILGYRMIGESATHASYTLTTSFAVPNSNMTIRFIAPPSGAVEIMVQIYANASTSNRTLYLALSDNATFNSIGATYENAVRYPDETDDYTLQHYWVVTGLTAGNTYNYWLGAKTSSTNQYLNWGGTSTGRYGDFIMKATALPAATSDFAEYN